MEINKIPLMNAIARKLSWLSQKQEVISQNVANANTPGYRSRVIEEPSFANILNNTSKSPVKAQLSQTMRKTSGKHINIASGSGGSQKANVTVSKNSSDGSTDGNTVVLEEQMMDMAKTQIEYMTMINLYKRHMGLVKTALGGRGR
jgi:flagellar basal-body rod protein FlgB